MRKVLIIFAVALCLAFAGCEKPVEWTPVMLDDSELMEKTVSPLIGSTVVHISGGSGEYSVVISEPSLAYVSIERYSDPEMPFGYLVIEPKKEGDAVITVTDKKSGSVAVCSLKVAFFTTAFEIADVRVDIDADHSEAIETDLEADTQAPPVGGAILLSSWNEPYDWAFTDAGGTEFARGTVTRKEITEMNPAFANLWPKVQIYSGIQRWTLLGDDETRREYNMIVVSGSATATRLSLPVSPKHVRFYEDLTGYYVAKYPDAGVRSVARVVIAKYPN